MGTPKYTVSSDQELGFKIKDNSATRAHSERIDSVENSKHVLKWSDGTPVGFGLELPCED